MAESYEVPHCYMYMYGVDTIADSFNTLSLSAIGIYSVLYFKHHTANNLEVNHSKQLWSRSYSRHMEDRGN